MDQKWTGDFEGLTTPLLADACLMLRIPLRAAQPGINAVIPGQCISGRALTARHYGSVDVFLEAIEDASAGDVLVVDNGGRTDEGCVGDLIVLEAQAAGLAGIVIWGLHRDTADIIDIGLPVYSYGTNPAGPQRLYPRDTDPFGVVSFGGCLVSRDDTVFADRDGVLFIPTGQLGAVAEAARAIQARERRQAERARGGQTLRQQFQFADYLTRRAADPSYTFRVHLKGMNASIEE